MIHTKGITVKLSPSVEQMDLLNRWFGCQWFVWNQFLNMLQVRYESNKSFYHFQVNII